MSCCDVAPSGRVSAPDQQEASRALHRLVGFVASALDTRFAFVVASPAPDSEPRRIALWLARDYGLRTEFATLEAPGGETLDLGELIRRARPYEPELAGQSPHRCVAVALQGAKGRFVGHLGILDSDRSCRYAAKDRLTPLARRAAAEVVRWIGAPD